MGNTGCVVYSDIIWALVHLESLATWLIVPNRIQANKKKITKAPHCWTFVRESSTDDLWIPLANRMCCHYSDVIMTMIASQITSLTVVYSTVYSDTDQRKHQSSASLAFVRGIHRDRWIPRTKGQLRGKCFHLMTSSCHVMAWLWINCALIPKHSSPYVGNLLLKW